MRAWTDQRAGNRAAKGADDQLRLPIRRSDQGLRQMTDDDAMAWAGERDSRVTITEILGGTGINSRVTRLALIVLYFVSIEESRAARV
jgi:hypothetical protein